MRKETSALGALLKLNKTTGNRLELGQKRLHTEGREGSKAQGRDFNFKTTLKPFPPSLNWKDLSVTTGTCCQRLPHFPHRHLAPPGCHEAPVLQGCSGLCHTMQVGETLCTEVQGGNRIKITTCSSKMLLWKCFWHPLVGSQVNTGFRHLKSFFLAAPHLEPYTTPRNALPVSQEVSWAEERPTNPGI